MLILILLLATTLSSWSQNLLSDPGFEIDKFYQGAGRIEDGHSDGWVTYQVGGSRRGTEIGIMDPAVVRSGSFALRMDAAGFGQNQQLNAVSFTLGSYPSPFPTLNVPVHPGDVFNFNGWARNSSSQPLDPGSFTFLNLQFRGLDANNQFFTQDFQSALINAAALASGNWTYFETGPQVAPAGVFGVSAYIKEIQRPPGFEGSGSIYFDDMSLVLVPEPSSVLLLFFGTTILGTLRYRRG